MNKVLPLPTAFLPSILYFQKLLRSNFVIEINESYNKQTIRNRYEILTSNGIQLLSIPVVHGKGKKLLTKDIAIDYSTKWRVLHARAIKTAYASSPYFEDYYDGLTEILLKDHELLIDKNNEMLNFLFSSLDLEFPITYTNDFITSNEANLAFNYLDKEDELGFSYQQVIGFSPSFVPNLSMIDLLFNEGPMARKLVFP